MKILLLIDSLVSGGRERRLIELIKGFANYSDVQLNLVVFSEKIHYQEIFELGIPVNILKRVPKRNPMVFYRLYKLCKSWKPDLMHSWGTMSAIMAIPSSMILGIKLINGNITDAPKNMSFFDVRLFRARLTYPFSKVVVGNSLAGLQEYRAPAHKSVCIYNGFDSNRLSNLKNKSLVREQFNIKTEKIIGMVGSFFDRKDYATFIKAALLLFKQREDVTFIAVGDGPTLKNCKQMVPSDHTPYFVFTGSQTDVESIINIFDIGVLATNEKMHGEGISNAILEYMALGKPTVATIGGGTDEVVDHMKTGILVAPGSPKIMANQLIYLLDLPTEMKRMGHEGKSRLERSFSLSKMTSAYYALYQKLLQ
ncbi:glycosyltransferase [Maribacter arenosus]|uniref:Glycosyltransferase n=1 Tax=Maribacter arenosus TaxID=1854708 RepID=A0ABR7VG23_9FLAO|nr:glycosyltransferase [Maribacter arenosus]MBD0852596.1 glycosyltransferase [Maribacter arenosus]